MRIVYCLNAICYGGGIERVTIAKANALADIPDNEVWILVTDNKYGLPLPLSEKVHLMDLGIRYYENQSSNPFIDIFKESFKRRRHKILLQEELERLHPDILISVGQGEKYILPSLSLSSNPVLIREIHYYKHYRRDFADNWQKKLLARLAEWFDYGWKIRKYDAIISLTDTDRSRYWNGNKKVQVIPNPVIAQPETISSGDNKVVMAVGRLVAQKNFCSLLHAWKIVEARYPDWSLQIWGDGVQRSLLLQTIFNLELHHVELKGFTSQIIERYPEASALAVTSRYEGFALTILEAMSAGLPVVSYDCPCSPRDIISDGDDGFLVDTGDEVALGDRLCWLIEHPDERKLMGSKAIAKASHYSLEAVAEKWMSLFRELR